MIAWPFDALANGLRTTVRDKGAWDGAQYHEGDKAVWTMSYAR
jgi:hypothetical protein